MADEKEIKKSPLPASGSAGAKAEKSSKESHDTESDASVNKKPVKKDKKIGSGGLIDMLQEALKALESIDEGDLAKPFPPVMDASPFEVLEEGDFDSADPALENFLSGGGPKGVIKVLKACSASEVRQVLSTLLERTSTIRTASRAQVLRQAYAATSASLRGDRSRLREARKAIAYLLGEPSSAAEATALERALDAISHDASPHIGAAALRVKGVYAGYVPQTRNAATPVPVVAQAPGTRVAYTTLRTQTGEPFLMCPKYQDTYGYAAAVEVSKCREQCIDSRTASTGGTTCAYADWKRIAMQRQDSVLGGLEVQGVVGVDGIRKINLAEGKRLNPEGKDEKSLEQRLSEDGDRTEDGKSNAKVTGKRPGDNDSVEAWLAKTKLYGHQGDDVDGAHALTDNKDSRGEKADETHDLFSLELSEDDPRESSITQQNQNSREKSGVDAENLEHQLGKHTPRIAGKKDQKGGNNEPLGEVQQHQLQDLRKREGDNDEDESVEWDDESLSRLLEDEHASLSEEDLDVLEKMLSSYREGKEG